MCYIKCKENQGLQPGLFKKHMEGDKFMLLTIVGRKVNLRPSFKELAEKKISKLDKFFHDEATATLTVTVEKNHHKAELTVLDSGIAFRAEQTADDMEEALDLAVDAIIRQIRKNKTRLERRLRDNAFEVYEPYADKEYEVVRRKSVSLKPMTTDEAIMQMELVGHMFFMFIDSDTSSTSIVYRRNDGGYGVIEAEE